LRYLKYLLVLFVLWPTYFFIKLLPRDKKIWCFSSYRDSYVDNSKYLYHFASTQLEDIRCYWVSDDESLINELREQGFLAVKRNSLQGALIILRAKYVFFSAYVSEVHFWLTSGARLVNLWHGLPLKKIEFDIDSGHLAKKYASSLNSENLHCRLFNPSAYRRFDLMFAPSKQMSQIFSSAFRIPESKVLTSGSPRTDQFFKPELFPTVNNYPDWVNDSINSDRKLFIYMPTFRDVGGEFFSKDNFDFDLLEQTMKKLDGEFWIKAHPAVRVYDFDVSKYERIKLLPSYVDMYPLLKESAALITDYSSIYIDYLLLDKPIYFYCFDLEHYLATCRSMYFDYKEATPGPKCITFEELCRSLLESKAICDHQAEVKTLFWGEHFEGACQVLCEHIVSGKVDR